MEFYISPQSGQLYMINVLENQWLSVTYKGKNAYARNKCYEIICKIDASSATRIFPTIPL